MIFLEILPAFTGWYKQTKLNSAFQTLVFNTLKKKKSNKVKKNISKSNSKEVKKIQQQQKILKKSKKKKQQKNNKTKFQQRQIRTALPPKKIIHLNISSFMSVYCV